MLFQSSSMLYGTKYVSIMDVSISFSIFHLLVGLEHNCTGNQKVWPSAKYHCEIIN